MSKVSGEVLRESISGEWMSGGLLQDTQWGDCRGFVCRILHRSSDFASC